MQRQQNDTQTGLVSDGGSVASDCARRTAGEGRTSAVQWDGRGMEEEREEEREELALHLRRLLRLRPHRPLRLVEKVADGVQPVPPPLRSSPATNGPAVLRLLRPEKAQQSDGQGGRRRLREGA